MRQRQGFWRRGESQVRPTGTLLLLEEGVVTEGTVRRWARPTMRDVARAAGVSTMTVSRVMNGDARVAPTTRASVESAIAKLGYRFNEVARSLRPGRTSGLLGLVVPNLAIRFYSLLALALEEELQPRNLSLVLGNTGFDTARERQLVERLLSRQVDGVLIAPAGREQAHLLEAASHTPFVFVNHPPFGIAADCVLHDDVGGARAATIDLIERGHHRIAYAGFSVRSYTNAQRLRGFRSALREHGIRSPQRYVLQQVHDSASTETAVRALLSEPDPPTAIFTAYSHMTIGAVRAMYAVGRHLEIAQFGDFEMADLLGCPLTIAVNNRDQLATIAVRLLLERIDGVQVEPRRIYVPTRLERREPVQAAQAMARRPEKPEFGGGAHALSRSSIDPV